MAEADRKSHPARHPAGYVYNCMSNTFYYNFIYVQRQALMFLWDQMDTSRMNIHFFLNIDIYGRYGKDDCSNLDIVRDFAYESLKHKELRWMTPFFFRVDLLHKNIGIFPWRIILGFITYISSCIIIFKKVDQVQ